MIVPRPSLSAALLVTCSLVFLRDTHSEGDNRTGPAPRPDESQEPFAMHSKMSTRPGIRVGQSDELLRRNRVLRNGADGVFFRNETLGMAAHRNRIEENIIEDNGTKEPSAGIRVRGETHGLIFKGNTIRDTRSGDSQTQTTGALIEKSVGRVKLEKNKIEAKKPIDDRRGAKN